MPFTPFHLGPGALVKAAAGPRFSFVVSGGTQLLMDVEPLIRMLARDPVLHGPTHSIAGALGIAALATLLGRPLGNRFLALTGIQAGRIAWRVAAISALVGSLSHVALDAIMHADMAPLWPFSTANPLLGAVSLRTLHLACLGSGLIGGAILLLRGLRRA